jgi:hypothetical protein
MQTLDFCRSYIRWRVDSLLQPAVTVTHVPPTTLNNVRINLECRCELIERRTGKSHTYVLGASCKTERVGADHDCWLEPNADFCLVASQHEFLILKSWARNGLGGPKHPDALGVPQERQSGKCGDVFADFQLQYRPVRGRALQTLNDIIDAVRGDRAIVSRTEYFDGDYQVVIEHPVKTINYSEREEVFQTDTGPILLPDLSPARLKQNGQLVDCFDLAYSAFNSALWAEFLVKVPTPIGEGMTVNHYSQPRRIEPARNMLIEVLGDVHSHMHGAAGDRLIRTDAAEVGI